MVLPNCNSLSEKVDEWVLRGHVIPDDDSLLNSQRFDNSAYLEITIEDVSLQDVESTLFVKKEIEFEDDDRFPIYYEIPYPEVNLSTVYSINVRATIRDKDSGKLIYMSTVHNELPFDSDKINQLFPLKVTKIASNQNDFIASKKILKYQIEF